MNFLKNIFKETSSNASENSKEDVKYFELNKIQPVVIVDTALYRSFQNQPISYIH